MMRMIIYSRRIKALQDNETPKPIQTVDDLESEIKSVVVDARRLLTEALQLEAYLFTPVPETEQRQSVALSDWKLSLDHYEEAFDIVKLVKEEREFVISQVNC